MISEEMLKKAAAEAEQAIRDSLPAPAACKHEFSPSFQRKMRRAFRKAKHPIIYKFPKYVASFVLVAILTSSIWLTVDAEVRAAFFAWVREQYETFIEYRFAGDTTQNDKSKQYELTQVPDGFFESNRMESKGNAVVIYQNESGEIIQFTCSQGDDSISLFLESDTSDVQIVRVGNIDAEFYLSSDPDKSNGLVWQSEDGNTFFCITSTLPQDIMLRLAESVQVKK